MVNNSTDFVLQEKFRNPTPEDTRIEDNWKWKWATPIKIQRDGTIHLNGLLDTENAVSTKNLKDGAVTTNKIDDGAVTEDKIDDGAVSKDKIADKAVTLEKLNENIKIPRGYLDIGSILQESSDDPENKIRPITANTIRKGAIVHSKLFNSGNAEGIGIDDQPPVWGENIKDQAITFNHMSNPHGAKPVNEEGKYPISGIAHIQKRSIPLNRLSEPIFTLQKTDTENDEYTLNLYHINGDALFDGAPTIESWRKEVRKCDTIINAAQSQVEVDSAIQEKQKYERWIANADNAYYIDIYDTDFNWDTTFYEKESSV